MPSINFIDLSSEKCLKVPKPLGFVPLYHEYNLQIEKFENQNFGEIDSHDVCNDILPNKHNKGACQI